jgi:hypothetical protein
MKLIITFQLILISIIASYSQERIKVLNEVPYKNIELSFAADTFDKYIIIERVANVSDGEIYWIKDEVDTVSIKIIENNESHVSYEVSESKNSWMEMLYERTLYHLINEDITFPTIKYRKNKFTKLGVFPDSCNLSEFTSYHLKNRIKLLKEIKEYRHVSTFEVFVQKIKNCNVNNYNFLQQSRNIIALDNYIIPANSDTLKYEIIQYEHFGNKTKIASTKTKNEVGHNIIQLIQYEDQEENKEDWKKSLETYKDGLDDEQIKSYKRLINSAKSYNKATLEFDDNNKLIKYINKINRYYIDTSNQEQFRFYNYEIRKIANQ